MTVRQEGADVGWICAEEGWWLYWTKDAEYGAARQAEKWKTSKDSCGEGGHADSWW